MCFLPLGCLKVITTIGAIISTVISFALIGTTIFANVYKKKIIDETSEATVNNYLVYSYVCSVIFLFIGICGLYGSIKGGKDKKGNKCLLGIFTIGVILFFFVFLGGAIVFFFVPKTIFQQSCSSGGQKSLNAQLFAQSKRAFQTLCKRDCQCFVDSKNQILLAKLAIENFSNVTTNQNSKSAVKYQECQNYNKTVDNKNGLLLSTLQEFLNCGGWCDSKQEFRFYRFTNINSCVSQDCLQKLKPCHKAFKDFMFEKGETVAIVCLIACLICLLNIFTLLCICCHPKGKGSENFYARMIDEKKS